VAKVAGTGIEVWLIIGEFKRPGAGGAAQVDRAYHFLSPAQRQDALDYYARFPDEIDERLALEAQITPEWVAAHFPPRPGQPYPRLKKSSM
jgi:uncharacterized protein (DUF433 family)